LNFTADILVIGGGLAGSHLAISLQEKNQSVILVHTNYKKGECASLAPATLFNPAAALQAKKSLFAEESYAEFKQLQKSLGDSDHKIINENGVLRPCTDNRLYENFKKSALSPEWQGEWITWLERDELKMKHPTMQNMLGALMVNAGFTVNTPALIEHLHKKFVSNSGKIIEGLVQSVKLNEPIWEVMLDDGSVLKTRKIIFANGFGIKNFKEWSFLKLHPVKGETLTLKNTPISFPNAISARGYLAFLDKDLVIGSTYKHHFNQIEPDQSAQDYLLKKLTTIFPNVNTGILAKELWSGVRLSTSDRLPIIGEHPDLKNMFIITGFGSKGLMYSQISAIELANFITTNKPIRKEFSIQRFL
jgi:glycine/D-amino acid oxidase-like deaminating enzyme